MAKNFHIIELGYLALLAPFMMFPRPLSVILLLGIIALWTLRFSLSGHFVPQTPLNLAVLVLLIMILVNQIVGYDPYFGMSKFFGLTWSIAVFFAVVDYAQSSKHRIWYMLGFFVLVGLGLTVLALFGTDWAEVTVAGVDPAELLPLLIRGLPGAEAGFNANEISGTLLWFLPLTCAMSLSVIWQIAKKKEFRSWYLVLVTALFFLVALELVLLFLLQSRGAIIGLVLALIVILIFASKGNRLFTLGLFGLLGVGTFILIRIGPTKVYSTIFLQQSTGFEGRLTHWARGLTAIKLFPLTGLGQNAYRTIPHVLYSQFLVPQDYELTHVHNMYLQVAVDLGIPALIAYLAILILAAFLLFMAWQKGSDISLKFIIAGCGVALLSHAIYGLLDAVALGARPGVAFWYLLALVVSLHALTISRNKHPDLL